MQTIVKWKTLEVFAGYLAAEAIEREKTILGYVLLYSLFIK